MMCSLAETRPKIQSLKLLHGAVVTNEEGEGEMGINAEGNKEEVANNAVVSNSVAVVDLPEQAMHLAIWAEAENLVAGHPQPRTRRYGFTSSNFSRKRVFCRPVSSYSPRSVVKRTRMLSVIRTSALRLRRVLFI